VQPLLITAFDCNDLAEEIRDTCCQIQDSDLSDKEKSAILSNLGYNGKFFPDHDYIYQRNTNIEIADAPFNVTKSSRLFVKDAWLSLFAVMPSVLYNSSLYVPESIDVLSGFNYRIEIPDNYYSSSYPSTDQGDCKRIYTLVNNISENRVYANNIYQGSGNLVPAAIDADSEIKAEYNISVNVKIDHYKWRKYCCKRSYKSCTRYCSECIYRSSETQKEEISIVDTLDIIYYDNNLFADAEITDSYMSTSKLRFNYSNSARLGFQDSSYEFNQYAYDIAYSQEPYYAYTLRAEDYNQESMSNMLKDENGLIVKNTDNCSIMAFDFFNILEKGCDLEYTDLDFYIKTDKLRYKPGEIINVEIYPADVPVKIAYDDEIKDVIGTASFTAKPLNNKITAYYSSLQAEAVIYVADEDRFAIIYNLSVFGLLNYFIYVVLRKYWHLSDV